MRLIEWECRNFCQFRQAKIEFAPGMNVFVGPNGTGKSNALKGVYGTLTGDFSRNDGVKATNITLDADPKAPSWTNLKFEQGGQIYEMNRDLRRESQSLLMPDGTKVTRDALIREALEKILGVNNKILDKYVFVDQWRMFDFLAATPTDRAKTFAKLFGTENIEKVWKAVGDFQTAQPVTVTDEMLAQAEGEMAAFETAQGELQTQVEALWAYLMANNKTGEQAKAVVRAADLLPSRVAEAQSTAEELASCVDRVKFSEAVLQDKMAERVEVAETLAKFQPQAALASEVQRRWRQVETRRRQAEDLRVKVAHTERDLQEAAPLKPEDYVSDLDGAFFSAMDSYSAYITWGRKFLSVFDGRCSDCPTCGTTVSQLKHSPEEVTGALKAAEFSWKACNERLTKSKRYDVDLVGYVRRIQEAEVRLKNLKAQIEALQDADLPAMTFAEAGELLAAYTGLESDHRRLTQDESHLSAEAGKARGRHATVEKQLAQVEQQVAQLSAQRFDDASEAAARSFLADFSKSEKDFQFLSGQLSSKSEAAAMAKRQVEKLRSDKARTEKVAAWQSRLARFRDIFHRDNLPRRIAKNRLRGLESGTNAFLGNFGSPFYVQASEDLSFSAQFPDGKLQSAARLSGGEMMALALSFRLSVNVEFAKEVGLLCLDEPTVGLDSHNIAGLRVALARLKEISAAQGLQVVMITHETELAPFFDRVVDLSSFGGSKNGQSLE